MTKDRRKMSEEVFGVFFRDQDVWEYLVTVEDDEEAAREEAQRCDERAFQLSIEEGEGDTPTWEEFDGMHYVEPISPKLADEASAELARGFAVKVGPADSA